MGRRANGKGREVGRQTEESDENVVGCMVELKVQLVGVPCSQKIPLRVNYTLHVDDERK